MTSMFEGRDTASVDERTQEPNRETGELLHACERCGEVYLNEEPHHCSRCDQLTVSIADEDAETPEQ